MVIIVGLVLRVLGPAVKALAVALAAVAAVLAWGAVEDGMDKRKNKAVEVGTGL
ncbi:hypothetical protein [Actinomycetospora straminea]|uniref:Uncharacterized protein n=1 Tax=Actinomycetospora straminea TaxID=663607 RepID=A0ABP9EHX2_9PSEU|nr:hypothetical protein [Actinomycetospora straminea]MDD7933862.1 hypothetical protein [Actinomycetospora straminea]